jgi:hypothetical protein
MIMRKIKTGFQLAFMLFSCLSFESVQAQCSQCTNEVTENSSQNYTVNTGEKLCVPQGVSVSGIITLNGGTLCNYGLVNNIVFNSGVFENNGTYSNSSSIMNITNNGLVRIYCGERTVFDHKGSLSINSVGANDSVSFYMAKGTRFLIGGDLSVSNGCLKIFNGHPFLEGLPSDLRTVCNVFGALNVSNSKLRISNYRNGTMNIRGNINLNARSDKDIYNYGAFNCNGSFNVSGNAQNAANVTIDNYGMFNITNFLTLALNNGNVSLTNKASKPEPFFTVGKSITVSKNNNVISNGSIFTAGQDITFDRGTLTNSGRLSCRDLELKTATFTNNGIISISQNLFTSGAEAIINNNSQIYIGNDFETKATVNFGKGSLMLTTNFIHRDGGNFFGPDSLDGDSTNYALLLIKALSDNNGNLRNHLIVYDETYTGTGIRLDNYHNNVPKLGIPPVIVGYPPCFKNIFALDVYSSHNNPVCKSTVVTLTAKAYNTISMSDAPVLDYLFIPDSIKKTPPETTFVTEPVIANEAYSVLVTLKNGCTLTKSLDIFVTDLLAHPGLDTLILPGDTAKLGAIPSATGGIPPYIYEWSPNSDISDASISNPLAWPSISTGYILKVTDQSGCFDYQQVNISVVPPPSLYINTAYIDHSYHYSTILNGLGSSYDAGGIQKIDLPKMTGFNTMKLSFISSKTELGPFDVELTIDDKYVLRNASMKQPSPDPAMPSPALDGTFFYRLMNLNTIVFYKGNGALPDPNFDNIPALDINGNLFGVAAGAQNQLKYKAVNHVLDFKFYVLSKENELVYLTDDKLDYWNGYVLDSPAPEGEYNYVIEADGKIFKGKFLLKNL